MHSSQILHDKEGKTRKTTPCSPGKEKQILVNRHEEQMVKAYISYFHSRLMFGHQSSYVEVGTRRDVVMPSDEAGGITEKAVAELFSDQNRVRLT